MHGPQGDTDGRSLKTVQTTEGVSQGEVLNPGSTIPLFPGRRSHTLLLTCGMSAKGTQPQSCAATSGTTGLINLSLFKSLLSLVFCYSDKKLNNTRLF